MSARGGEKAGVKADPGPTLPTADVSAAGVGEARPAPSWMLLLVAIGILAWLRIFTTWFAQDDFRWLLRAAEKVNPPFGTPRPLSMWLYFRAMWSIAGPHPAAYHVANLVLHLGSGLLLFRALARHLGTGASAAAAAVFLASPALFDALHWVSAIAELMCGAFLVLTLWLLLRPSPNGGARPWLAVVSYALALGSKEIAVGAAPVLALLQWRAGGKSRNARAALTLALAALAAWSASGVWETGTGGSYALAPRAALLNLPAFVSAAVLGGTAWHDASDLAWGRAPLAQIAGWVLLALWLAALTVRRSKPAWLGFLWFMGLVAPVLWLERQFYLYYVYCALPGLVASVAFLVVGGGSSATATNRTARSARWAVAALLAAQVIAIEGRAQSRLPTIALPTNFVLRRSVIARNAFDDLTRQRAALGARVVLLGQQPVDASYQGQITTAPTDYRRDPWWDENVRGALSNGEALLLMFPVVREAVFKYWLDPADTAATIVPYQVDGHLEVKDYASLIGVPNLAAPATLAEHMERAGRFIGMRLFSEALRELEAARALAPDHPDVLINLGALLAAMGDSTAALATLRHTVAVNPGDVDALYNLGLLAWRMGRRAEAESTWARLLERAPDSDLARDVRALMAGEAR